MFLAGNAGKQLAWTGCQKEQDQIAAAVSTEQSSCYEYVHAGVD